MKKVRVAINGFGRIGRAFFKLAFDNENIEIVAVNELGDIKNSAYLLRYDTAYGQSVAKIEAREGALVVNGREVPFLQEKDPSKLPWREMRIDIAVEATGFFTDYKNAKAHLDAGAKRVVITAPAKGAPLAGVECATVLMGINEDELAKCQITSNGSCTTNAVSPVIQALSEKLGVEKAILNTVHAYTASQKIVDGPNAKDWREGRAAAGNIIPSSTGAAVAVTKAIAELEGKFDGISIRVPVAIGSIADITFIAKRPTTKEEVNDILRQAAGEKRWQKLLRVSDDPIVSSDIVGESHAAVVDAEMTRVVDGNLVKVLSWYDNEMGYAHTLIQHVIKMGESLG